VGTASELGDLDVELSATDASPYLYARSNFRWRCRAPRDRLRQHREVEPDHTAAHLGAAAVRGEAQRDLTQGAGRATRAGRVAPTFRPKPLRLVSRRRPLTTHGSPVLVRRRLPVRDGQPIRVSFGEVGALASVESDLARSAAPAARHPVQRQELPREQPRPGLSANGVLDLEQRRLVGSSCILDAEPSISTSRLRPGRNEIARSRRAGRAGARARPLRSRRWRSRAAPGAPRSTRARAPTRTRRAVARHARAAGFGLGIGLRQCVSSSPKSRSACVSHAGTRRAQARARPLQTSRRGRSRAAHGALSSIPVSAGPLQEAERQARSDAVSTRGEAYEGGHPYLTGRSSTEWST
jgi:hypothetical protein